MRGEEMPGRGAGSMGRKAIPAGRDRMQSELLTGAVGLLLMAKAGMVLWALHRMGGYAGWVREAVGFSGAFAVVVWLLRSATGPAAVMGGFVCMDMLLARRAGAGWEQTTLPALLTLFVLTFAATRYGRKRKEQMGMAEARRGRRASQVVANLGVAGLCAGAGPGLMFAACLAALAEATADTVSSEVGQALGGRTLLITDLSEVPAGTDGGISIAGTMLGAAAAGVVVLMTAVTRLLPCEVGMVVFGAAAVGLLFDSWLGATVERRGWVGNDLVNFSSTVFAAGFAYVGTRLLQDFEAYCLLQ